MESRPGHQCRGQDISLIAIEPVTFCREGKRRVERSKRLALLLRARDFIMYCWLYFCEMASLNTAPLLKKASYLDVGFRSLAICYEALRAKDEFIDTDICCEGCVFLFRVTNVEVKE